MNKGDYVIVRCEAAATFAGIFGHRLGREVYLLDARRIWYWEGAASLSELAERGTAAPDKCRFPCPVRSVMLLDAVEIIEVSEAGQKSIREVPEWTMHN